MAFKLGLILVIMVGTLQAAMPATTSTISQNNTSDSLATITTSATTASLTNGNPDVKSGQVVDFLATAFSGIVASLKDMFNSKSATQTNGSTVIPAVFSTTAQMSGIVSKFSATSPTRISSTMIGDGQTTTSTILKTTNNSQVRSSSTHTTPSYTQTTNGNVQTTSGNTQGTTRAKPAATTEASTNRSMSTQTSSSTLMTASSTAATLTALTNSITTTTTIIATPKPATAHSATAGASQTNAGISLASNTGPGFATPLESQTASSFGISEAAAGSTPNTKDVIVSLKSAFNNLLALVGNIVTTNDNNNDAIYSDSENNPEKIISRTAIASTAANNTLPGKIAVASAAAALSTFSNTNAAAPQNTAVTPTDASDITSAPTTVISTQPPTSAITTPAITTSTTTTTTTKPTTTTTAMTTKPTTTTTTTTTTSPRTTTTTTTTTTTQPSVLTTRHPPVLIMVIKSLAENAHAPRSTQTHPQPRYYPQRRLPTNFGYRPQQTLFNPGLRYPQRNTPVRNMNSLYPYGLSSGQARKMYPGAESPRNISPFGKFAQAVSDAAMRNFKSYLIEQLPFQMVPTTTTSTTTTTTTTTMPSIVPEDPTRRRFFLSRFHRPNPWHSAQRFWGLYKDLRRYLDFMEQN